MYNDSMKKYLFAFDLDGTLLNKKEVITPEVKEGIKKLQEMGHETCLITGRSWTKARQVYFDSGSPNPVGAFNGAVIKPGHNKTFKEVAIPQNSNDVTKILNNKLFKEYTKTYAVETLEDLFISDLNSETAALNRKLSFEEPKQAEDDMKYHGVIAIQAEMRNPGEEEADLLVKELKSLFPDHTINHWYAGYEDERIFSITNNESSKDEALKKIADHLGIPMENTISFGDGDNDREFLEAAGLGVVMKNASDQVKKYGDVVTAKTNDENGVMDHIFNVILK